MARRKRQQQNRPAGTATAAPPATGANLRPGPQRPAAREDLGEAAERENAARRWWQAPWAPPAIACAVSGLVALAVYLRTLAPSLPTGDSGELIAVARVLGVAHP